MRSDGICFTRQRSSKTSSLTARYTSLSTTRSQGEEGSWPMPERRMHQDGGRDLDFSSQTKKQFGRKPCRPARFRIARVY